MHNIKLSIIVPIFNTPEMMLIECLESLSSSKHAMLEFLLIDDGSEEFIDRICKKFILMDKRFKYFRQENQGVSAARNLGILKSNGKWITFLDPDDKLEKNFDEILLNYYDDSYDILFGGYTTFFSDGKLKCSYSGTELVNLTEDNNRTSNELLKSLLSVSLDYSKSQGFYLGTPWGKFIKRSFIFENSIFFDTYLKKRQDALFAAKMYAKDPKVCTLNQNIYYYRIDNDKSITKRYNSEIKKIYLHLFQEIEKTYYACNIKETNPLTLYSYDLTKELINLDFCNVNNNFGYKKRQQAFLEFRETEKIKKYDNFMFNKEMKLWKNCLYYLIKHKMFFVLNFIYLERKFTNIIGR
ncbi:glycosyltransferase family 2 protein [Enterococcus avium]|jgi:glycosyltransferase involved in cell wall biosynthesis|uniref:glycosyltransferase family 2 protein n=2 Tax=Enterococcus TaxID=1350 RepID=UPI00039C6C4A|nr:MULTISPECIES: glycosyltransferase family 2 protein [Enterococcus]KAA9133037.1 glycosyltransferase family 2 protein [Enterococcus faecium]KAA9136234.1 glycosyltransferase family 2 protein [Enterococcus faecium]KAA9137372.1 glycosyltransferase family 2 protein [Enterococcus faecium]KAA9142184.1 glycosyltransferase family 2 protein [Enterococcus faecium]KAA9142728.1 glycosyltransferase family 2 protein [Enterococcus faecium]